MKDTTKTSLKYSFASAAMGTAGVAAGMAASFGAPWIMAGFATLPWLWRLMRSTPPAPRQEDFPAMRILMGLESKDQEPARMPLWQKLIRMTAVSLAILGLADPDLDPDQPLEGDGPLMVVIDNGWASAKNWAERAESLQNLIDRADNDDRDVVILSTAPAESGEPFRLSDPMTPDMARETIKALAPHPWPVDRQTVADSLAGAPDKYDPASVVWLSNGLDDEGARALADNLKKEGPLTVVRDQDEQAPHLLVPPVFAKDELTITIKRPHETADETMTLTARDDAGYAIDQVEAEFKDGETETTAVFELPSEIRNQLTRVSLDGENTAGATLLLDERWRRHPVGLLAPNASQANHVLQRGNSFIKLALDPYADLDEGRTETLLRKDLSVIIMTDEVALGDNEEQKIEDWVRQGGTLLRFAGPRMASGQDKDLLPVALREGHRTLGGGISGETPGRLGDFDPQSPFAGLTRPDEITVRRTVQAQPGPDLDGQTWARLQDGTPLVTARQDGEGWIVLVHTTASTDWSDLSLSGTFLDMMRAVVSHSKGVDNNPDGPDSPLPPVNVMDAFGRFTSPPAGTMPLTKDAVKNAEVSPRHPPGFYGKPAVRRAYNMSESVTDVTPLGNVPGDAQEETYNAEDTGPDMPGMLLAGSFALVVADLMILLGQKGRLPFQGSRNTKTPQPKGTRRREFASKGPA